MNMYVSNLSYQATEDDLRDLFGEFGNVSSARIITDRETGRSRGFAFVEMDVVDEARTAMEKLNDKEIYGRAMSVSVAKERAERSNNGSYNKKRNFW